MDPADLQLWLLHEGIRDDLATATIETVRNGLDNLTTDFSKPSSGSIDWPRLLLAGTILARSEGREGKEAALRIATAAISLTDEQVLKDAGLILMGKLSNFRAAGLAVDRKLAEPKLDERLGVTLRLEAQRREMDNSILIESNGTWLQVNDFQNKFWTSASKDNWLSASAPTASGKTFLVLQWLVDQILTGNHKVAVYLAPTRALVSEIEMTIKKLLESTELIEVSSLPLAEKYKSVREDKRKSIIFVFTQERLHLLANTLGDSFAIDLLIVDEAHKIGDKQRGVILQDAIERTTRSNPKLKAVFVSPATENPEELLKDAPSNVHKISVDSDSSTVLQNLITARQVPRTPKLWSLTLKQKESEHTIGFLNLPNSPSNMSKRLAFIAAAVGERGGTLVYANGAGEAEKVAYLIGELSPDTKTIDPDLTQLADLARKGVHPDFLLARVVERGVAFHYGNMPSLIRLEIERLFRSGKIRFLVCTSTLIEGVNLSCGTIVVRGPRKGKGHPMDAHDFWNLAGRAGRWGSEFQGNIICIDPDDTRAWPTGVPERSRFPIKRESDAIIENTGDLLDYLSNRELKPVETNKDRDRFEHVSAYLLATFLRLGSISNANLAKRHLPDSIIKLDQKLSPISDRIEISADLASRHPGVSPIGLQHLLEAFRSYRGNVENLLPAEVASYDSYDRFVTIMERINEHVFPVFTPSSRIRLYALIVTKWLKGYSLSKIIQGNIEWHKKVKKSFKLPNLIRDTMELVEQEARFRAPKYFSAYIDVLHFHLHQIRREDLIDENLDIGTQLEFGVSSKTLLSLMELGLSRMSAVTLYERMVQNDLSRDDCKAWISERISHFEAMGIPYLIIEEIRRCTKPQDTPS